MTTPPDVPFCRSLRRGMTGQDVAAHKRALNRAFPDLYPKFKHGYSDFYGPVFANAVAKAQTRMNYTHTGEIDKITHEKLERRKKAGSEVEYAFDDYAVWLCERYCEKHQPLSVREKIVKAGFYWYAHRGRISYSMSRPYELCKPLDVPDKIDCSGFFTICHYAGGAKDPNNLGYNGQGYTGTLLANGAKCRFSDLKPGDAIFYGFSRGRPGFPVGSPTHVALYVGNGNVLSMGSYPIKYLEYDYRSDINCYVKYDL